MHRLYRVLWCVLDSWYATMPHVYGTLYMNGRNTRTSYSTAPYSYLIRWRPNKSTMVLFALHRIFSDSKSQEVVVVVATREWT